ncbi:DUF4190 domain-containing protein [Ruminococcus sp.]|uniref:DUF4190 domain-containing protein n=1 Tax=Ruminococcus sp. TaxID=41978 RepID=UPI0025F19055|nr:DUF4190 domain-containing protein [Ruminococcus sp.]MBQ6252763.1 DUF4190 domain-containing protein [Ruminococcus sp.]
MDNNYNNDNNQQNMSTDPYAQGGGYVQDPYNNGGLQPQGSKGKAIASMVLGICAVVFGCCVWAWLGLILGVIAIVLSVMVIKNNEAGRGMAIAGLVCGIVGAATGLVSLIIVAVVGESLKEWAESLQDGALFIK